jgi:hypothetical protein
MKKITKVILAGGLLIVIFLSGCITNDTSNNENSKNHPDFSRFMGEWLEEGEAPNNLTWIFNENGTIKFLYYPGVSVYTYWANFELDGNRIDVASHNIVPVSDVFVYEFYEFADNTTKLTLTSINGGDVTVINKVE